MSRTRVAVKVISQQDKTATIQEIIVAAHVRNVQESTLNMLILLNERTMMKEVSVQKALEPVSKVEDNANIDPVTTIIQATISRVAINPVSRVAINPVSRVAINSVSRVAINSVSRVAISPVSKVAISSVSRVATSSVSRVATNPVNRVATSSVAVISRVATSSVSRVVINPVNRVVTSSVVTSLANRVAISRVATSSVEVTSKAIAPMATTRMPNSL